MAGILKGISQKGTHAPAARKRLVSGLGVEEILHAGSIFDAPAAVLGLAIGAMVYDQDYSGSIP
jgi:hypothetical protein